MRPLALDDLWEDLLEHLEDRRVIPIIGPGLLVATSTNPPLTLYDVVAERLAERLHISAQALSERPSLNDVVCAYVDQGGRREEVYPRVRALMKELAVAPPDAIRRLARIRNFDLFVSLTWDSLLVEAINQERYGGSARTQHIAYSPNNVEDLPVERRKLTTAVVYSLLGKLSAAPDYVVTDEDLLEFLTALQSESRRPHLLFDELQSNHLLFLGCPLSDWLARFFIRTAKNRPLSMQRGELEILVDPVIGKDRNLGTFLQHFSYGTRVFDLDPQEFVAELARRWAIRSPANAEPAEAPTSERAVALPDMPQGAIFVSYAKEDAAFVNQLVGGLEAAGIEVWFDRRQLEAGDLYDNKIRRNIKSCSYFMPVISRNTGRRLEGYFRREWKLAEERSLGMATHVPFIIPVVIDQTEPYGDDVPERFAQAQWTHLPQGRVEPEFAARMVHLIREFRKRERGII